MKHISLAALVLTMSLTSAMALPKECGASNDSPCDNVVLPSKEWDQAQSHTMPAHIVAMPGGTIKHCDITLTADGQTWAIENCAFDGASLERSR